MLHVNYSDIVVATVVSFIFSAVYYTVLSKQVNASRAEYVGKKHVDTGRGMSPTKVIVELVRTFILGLVLAYAVAMLDLLYIQQALLLALWLWIGFPVVLLVGSVVHEKFPVRLAVIHAFDWLVKLLIFTVILTYWR
jgi:hypothetical protein